MTIIHTLNPNAHISEVERRLRESSMIDERLRGYYFFPIQWFVTGEMVNSKGDPINVIFVHKTEDFGERPFHDALVMNVYLPFEFERHEVRLS